ncbi:MAG: N-formylglutamate amidohydrolase [Promethearchaeia archaeon]
MSEDYKDYFKYQYGDLPIILSVPHGGVQRVKDIPKRENGILGIDKGTIDLTFTLIKYIRTASSQQFGTPKIPSYVISYVHRNRIDFNRGEYKAFQRDSQLAEKLYGFYHQKLQEYTNRNIKKYGTSYLIDIHGFEKDKRPSGFRDVDIVLGTLNLKSLFQRRIPKKDRDKNIRGRVIKECLEEKIAVAPSRPRRKEYVLKGGYITQQYGAKTIKDSRAMQIELSDAVRLYNDTLSAKVMQILSGSIIEACNSVRKNRDISGQPDKPSEDR